jgi:hypothetical protein
MNAITRPFATGGWSNHAPVPEHVELVKVHYTDNRVENARG